MSFARPWQYSLNFLGLFNNRVFALKTFYFSFIMYNLQAGWSNRSGDTSLGHSAALCELNALKESFWPWSVQHS